MPRDEYKTITIRNETYERFIKTATKARKLKPRLYISDFVDMLLDMYEKKR